MSDISNRIDALLNAGKLKRADIVKATGISEGTIRNWIRGTTPSCDAICKVADFFNVSVRWLITGEEDKTYIPDLILSDEEKELIELYRHLNKSDKNAVMTLASSLEKQYCAMGNGAISSS